MRCILKGAEYGVWVSWCGKTPLKYYESYTDISKVLRIKPNDVCKECLGALIKLLRVLENESLAVLI